MAKAQDKVTPAERLLMIDVLEEALRRTKLSPPSEEHKVAVRRYKRELVKSLKKLDPRGHYYAD